MICTLPARATFTTSQQGTSSGPKDEDEERSVLVNHGKIEGGFE